ncbi:uncharacterized protein LOC111366359 [Olea europaea var. sylvestris]|uniref:uncharacterized protein LOC111366359 n=1 Tax=Olea europaea var. sylvestris TaxID=158386 RepID=UPI000C1D3C43|nr:uncharacterized protein LOC111366359 [Olea europaea var. sylvestris]
MAKGRKLTTSRSERFLGSFGYNREQETVAGSSEFGEDEVWSTFDNTVNADNHLVNVEWTSVAGSESNGSFPGYRSRSHAPRAASHEHHTHRHVGGLSSAFEDSSSTRIAHQFRSQDNMAESPRGGHIATSAPVNVPDWSKIYRINSSESLHNSDDGFEHGESELVPPHEYLARSQDMAANSMFEGVGRTLKGRDMSRVRDAVWSQTGFHG